MPDGRGLPQKTHLDKNITICMYHFFTHSFVPMFPLQSCIQSSNMHEPWEPIVYSNNTHARCTMLLTRTYNICLGLQGGEMKMWWNCTFTLKAKDNMVAYSSLASGNTPTYYKA